MTVVNVSTLADLPRVAACHARVFPQSLSTRLGTRSTMKMLEWYVVSPRGTLLHVERDGAVVGYLGGVWTMQPGLPGAFTSISQHAFGTFVAAYLARPWLLFHPENRNKQQAIVRNVLIRARLRRRQAPVSDAARAAFRSAFGIVVIGVDPADAGHGTGSLLMQEAERMARDAGVSRIRLSVRRTNERAIRFYSRHGFAHAHGDADTSTMRKDL